ncbi:MAG: hypothetical protein B6I37_01505 [Desulfobacteraceae bacterium 4572_35.2]|nr:MAG: hypothetical protein B6I37_01505 [Desulfobacteraceae bacterium 4572_35.2]
MKFLSKIILVNWYLLDGVELEIKGNTAIVGPNGSGKSSILDAVQTVLAGRDRNKLNLNAGASGKGKRSVHEYCLGVISNAAGQNVYFRKTAHTHIALVFHDDVTNTHTTVGISMTASTSLHEENVEGRFVVPGMNASLSDFVRHTSNDRRSAIPWVEVKSTIDRLHPQVIYYPGSNAFRFVSELLTQLSEDPGCPMIDTDQFLRNLQNAIAFVPIGDPTMFVRDFILQNNDLSIDDLRGAMKNYEEMNAKHQQVSERIDDLTQIETLCKKVKTHQRNIAYFRLISLWSNKEHHIELSEPINTEIEDIEQHQIDCADAIKEFDDKREQFRNQLNEAKNELANSTVKARITALQQKKDVSRRTEELSQKELDTTRNEISELLRCNSHFALLPPELVSSHQALTDHVNKEDALLDQLWPTQPQQVDHAIDSFVGLEQQTRNLRSDKQARYITNKDRLETEIGGVLSHLKQLRDGKSPLSHDTLAMVAILKKNNIESRPFCDLCDVTDETWRLTIEGILKGNREALIVDSKDAHEAVRIYRQNKRDCPKAKVIDTTKTKRWINKVSANTLATIMSTEDEDVRAFINRQLGNIEMVETEKELLATNRGATADGIFYNGGVTSSIERPRPYPILGRESQALLLEQLEKELEQLQQEFNDTDLVSKNLNAVEEVIRSFVNFCDRRRQSVEKTKKEREEAHLKTSQLDREIAELEQNQDTTLQSRIGQLEGVVAQLKADTDAQQKKQIELAQLLGRKTGDYAALQTKITTYEAQEKELTGQPMWDSEGWDFADVTDRFLKLQEQFNADHQLVISHCLKKQQTLAAQLNNEESAVYQQTWKHQSQYATIGGVSSFAKNDKPDFDELYARIASDKQKLIDTSLAEYAAKSQQALHDAEFTFRSQFIFKIKESIDKVKSQLSELNRTLKKITFHGERYTFKWSYNPEYKNIVKLFDAIDENPNFSLSGLFDPSNDPTSPHYDAIQEINGALKDSQQSSRLEDYRSYFVFDIEMHSQDGELKSNMRNRIAKGSGGEGQSPYYVAIGAALASTYRLRNTSEGVKGGIHLIMFDEAFSKLDVENCGNCLNFLQDINLQVLLGAPDEKHTILSASMDTIINIYREEQAIDISIEYPTKAAHALLQQDNPTINKPVPDSNATIGA